jgi:two-component system chemotaxis sensor kinase CheA
MTGPDNEFQKKLLTTFREEAEEYVNTITEGLLELEKTGPETGTLATERIFRTIHSLKGAARAVSVKEIELVCQNLENIFAAVKKGEYTPDADAFDIFHIAVKIIRSHVQGVHAQQPSSADVIVAIRGLIVPKKNVENTLDTPQGNNENASLNQSPVIRVVATPGQNRDNPPGRKNPATAFSKNGTTVTGTVPLQSSTLKEGPYSGPGGKATVRIAAHKLDCLIEGSDDLLTTRLFITHRMRELEEMMTRFAQWRWNHAMTSSDGRYQKNHHPSRSYRPTQPYARVL